MSEHQSEHGGREGMGRTGIFEVIDVSQSTGSPRSSGTHLTTYRRPFARTYSLTSVSARGGEKRTDRGC
jgi:hypothetical protein